MAIVLVVTNSYDDHHVNAVRKVVEVLGFTMFRFDTDLLVKGVNSVTFDYQDGYGTVMLRTSEGTLCSADIDSVWYRKPFGFGNVGFVESINDPVQRGIVAKEVSAVLNGLFAFLADCYWLNKPDAITRAQLKPYQILLAREIGFNLPDTIITSDPQVAREFCSVGPTIFKPLVEAAMVYGEQAYAIDTTLLTERHLAQLDLIKAQPVLLQRYVDKAFELRVTYVGGELFVARQELTSSAPLGVVDWRSLQGTSDSVYTPYALSSKTAHNVKCMMRKLNLGFGALDFAVAHDGTEFFLEVNPNGQWFGYTDEIGLPAAATIARCLVNRTDGIPMSSVRR
jgi:glutathione synthase/RimK-type ligase-like ATP-grasp enzyme